MEGKILLMQEIRLYIEKLSKENFDNFIDLRSKFLGSEKTLLIDAAIINRLKDDAFSINPKYEAYLGKIGLDYIAYAIFRISYSTLTALPSLFLDEIFVINNFRNLDIGMTLFNFCIRKAKKRGCCKIELAVSYQNEKAKFFFESNGAIPIGMTYYQIDPLDVKIGKPLGKMTYADFMRKKSKSKPARLNSRAIDNSN
jgi:GNAT superfamily N-acetyltransferase